MSQSIGNPRLYYISKNQFSRSIRRKDMSVFPFFWPWKRTVSPQSPFQIELRSLNLVWRFSRDLRCDFGNAAKSQENAWDLCFFEFFPADPRISGILNQISGIFFIHIWGLKTHQILFFDPKSWNFQPIFVLASLVQYIFQFSSIKFDKLFCLLQNTFKHACFFFIFYSD